MFFIHKEQLYIFNLNDLFYVKENERKERTKVKFLLERAQCVRTLSNKLRQFRRHNGYCLCNTQAVRLEIYSCEDITV